MTTLIKTEQDIRVMQEICTAIADILDNLIPSTIYNYSNTMQLANQIELWLNEKGITSIKNFIIDGNLINTPVHISTESTVVHGLPSEAIKIPKNGLLRVDLVGFKHGMYGDAARTYKLGQVSEQESKITDAAYEVLYALEREIKPHDRFSKIARVIEYVITKNNFATSARLTGHGIGAILHDWPAVHNTYSKAKHYLTQHDFLLDLNMTFAIEPLLFEAEFEIIDNSANHEVYVKSLSSICAHVENTYIMHASGLVPLTRKV